MKDVLAKYGKKIRINEKTINFLLIFILGFLVGVAVKTEAKKRVTIGYNDYLIRDMKQGFGLMDQETTSGSQGQEQDQVQGEPQPEGAESQPQQ
ncbi:MAG: hypothetical protein WC831_05945 [Parcubacteria group bacterium]|jgi:hypothetical protein